MQGSEARAEPPAHAAPAYPNGGDALSKNIAKLILSNPKLAPDLVIYMRNAQGLNRAQKLAAEQGLATAANALGIKAADRPIITKDTVIATEPPDDLWLIALGLLGVAAAACIAACNTNNNNVLLPPTVH